MFAVLGEALLDMVQPVPGTTYVARPGGGPFNIAIGLRRLGHPTALLARLSTGGLGSIVRDHAVANDLDLSACIETTRSRRWMNTVVPHTTSMSRVPPTGAGHPTSSRICRKTCGSSTPGRWRQRSCLVRTLSSNALKNCMPGATHC